EIELEEAVLGRRVAEAKKKIDGVVRLHVRDAPPVAADPHHRGQAGGPHGAASRRHATVALVGPPAVELRSRPAGGGTDCGDRLAGAEAVEDVFGLERHVDLSSWRRAGEAALLLLSSRDAGSPLQSPLYRLGSSSANSFWHRAPRPKSR